MGLELIIDYHVDSREQRQREYDYCVRQNLAHPFIDRIHNLGVSGLPIADDIRGNPKWVEFPIDHRLTFKDAFAYANQKLEGKMVGTCNLDIFLDKDSDWSIAEAFLRRGKYILCQSRMEFTPTRPPYLDPTFAIVYHALTQDAWFFIAPLNVPDVDFELGTLGCDNALAERVRRVGYVPVNLASRFKVMHYDEFRGKNGDNTNEVHKAESDNRGAIYGRYPEREGSYLVPDFDRITSLDELAASLNLNQLHKYQIFCDMMSRFIKVTN